MTKMDCTREQPPCPACSGTEIHMLGSPYCLGRLHRMGSGLADQIADLRAKLEEKNANERIAEAFGWRPDIAARQIRDLTAKLEAAELKYTAEHVGTEALARANIVLAAEHALETGAVESAKDALRRCAAQFDRYYEIHHAKNTREADIKALENANMAQLCRDALAGLVGNSAAKCPTCGHREDLCEREKNCHGCRNSYEHDCAYEQTEPTP
jgi:hypothetical protein